MSFQTKQSFTWVIALIGLLLAMCAGVTLLALVLSRVLPGGGAIGLLTTRYGNMEIFLLDIARGTLHNLSDNDAMNSSFAFSPDGTRIAFASNKDGNTELYMMSMECPGLLGVCGGITQLTDGETDSGSPVWSPDGRRIAYVHDVALNDGDNEIYVVNVESRETVNVSNDAANDLFPIWSPDSQRIAFLSDRDRSLDVTYDTDMYIVNADGSNLERATIDMTYDLPAAWSPDGRYIAFTSPQDNSFDMMMLDLQTQDFHSPLSRDHYNINLVWSPDGSELAFLSIMGVVNDLCAMNMSTYVERCITTHFDGALNSFAWSPNGERITFNAAAMLYVIDASGDKPARFVFAYGSDPVWWP